MSDDLCEYYVSLKYKWHGSQSVESNNLISKFVPENLSRVLGHSVYTQHNVNDIVPVTGDGRNG